MKILVIGGAGFIGSHLVDDLLIKNHEVIVYDVLEPQVHGAISKPPEYLAKNILFIHNDIRNRSELLKSLKDIEVIFHLAAMVGVGQSMYQIHKYIDNNVTGTAQLLDILVNEPNNVNKLIVASSMSIYGEGAYLCEKCGKIDPELRKDDHFKKGDWELYCPKCSMQIKSIPTPEDKPQKCTSIYALTKKEQEMMCLMIGETYGIDTTALRFFNVYGSRQALSNPYTGVCAIFASRLLNGNSPIIYEDGNQTRDFVHVKDICQSLILSMEKKQSKNEVFNVGTGIPISINQIGQILAKCINPRIKPTINYKFRPGDIRHCIADISKIASKLGYKPKYNFESGIKELIDWVRLQAGKVKDKWTVANLELQKKGLIK